MTRAIIIAPPVILALLASAFLWLDGLRYDAKLEPMREAMRWGPQ